MSKLRLASLGALAIILSSGAALAQAGLQESGSNSQRVCPSGSDLLSLDYEEFDAPDEGWRAISQLGCNIQAADILGDYRRRHEVTLHPDEIRLLKWHEGQLRAASGDSRLAVSLFEEVRAQESDPLDKLYTEATIAFLMGDRDALESARRELAAIPEPPSFSRAADRYVAQYGLPRPAWPLNLEVVDALVRCFGRPYVEAYRGCPAGHD
jgi:hypothetical protein